MFLSRKAIELLEALKKQVSSVYEKVLSTNDEFSKFKQEVDEFRKEVDRINSNCKHLFGPIEPDGYQYCSVCCIAKLAEPKKNVCNHNWKVVEKNKITDGDNCIGRSYAMQCDVCGDIKSEFIGLDKKSSSC